MQLRAMNRLSGAGGHEHLRSEQHPNRRRNEVDPKALEGAREQSGPKCPGGIHAHTGEWRLKGDVGRDQGAGEDGRVSAQILGIGHGQNR